MTQEVGKMEQKKVEKWIAPWENGDKTYATTAVMMEEEATMAAFLVPDWYPYRSLERGGFVASCSGYPTTWRR